MGDCGSTLRPSGLASTIASAPCDSPFRVLFVSDRTDVTAQSGEILQKAFGTAVTAMDLTALVEMLSENEQAEYGLALLVVPNCGEEGADLLSSARIALPGLPIIILTIDEETEFCASAVQA